MTDNCRGKILKFILAFVSMTLIITRDNFASAQQRNMRELYYRLQCESFSSAGGLSETQSTVEASLKQFSPTLPANGYALTGGACESLLDHAEARLGIVSINKPVGGDGWHCRVDKNTSDPSDPLKRFVQAKVSLVACTVVAEESLLGVEVPWKRADGAQLVLARIGPGFQTEIPYSYRICNVRGNGAIDIYHKPGIGGSKPGLNDPPTTVPPGKCLEVDTPTELIVAGAPATSGTYQMFRKGTFKGWSVVSAPRQGKRDSRPVIANGTDADGFKALTAQCAPLPNAPAGIWGSCKVNELSGFQAANKIQYRVCFDDRTLEMSEGPSNANAQKYVLMGLENSILGMPLDETNQYDPRRNYTIPNNCRDLFDLTNTHFVIASEFKDAAKVKAVRLFVRPIFTN